MWSGGGVLDAGWLRKGRRFSADYFVLGRTNVITLFTPPPTCSNFFPERVIRNAAGVIQSFDAETINVVGDKGKGLDVGAEKRVGR